MKSLRTMILDDEDRIRRGIERLVQSCGDHWEIIGTFSDGKQALDYIHDIEGDVDLVISDVKMPEMDGLTFIHEARKNYSFSLLLISGYDDFHYLRTALREGAVDYLLKPLDRGQFRTRLKEIEAIIREKRQNTYKLNDMQRKANQLKHTKQTQILSEVTMTELDLSRLGYWVDDFPSGSFIIMNISLDGLPIKARNYTDQDWKAYSYALDNILGEVVTQYQHDGIQNRWWWRGETDYWVLLQSGHEDYDAFKTGAVEVAEKICSSIHHYTPFTVSVAQSDAIDDLYLLCNAKQQALSLMNYRLLYSGNKVFNTSFIKESGQDSKLKTHGRFQPIIRTMKRSIEQSDMKEANKQLEQWFAGLEEVDSPSLIQWLLQYLILQIHSVWMESNEEANHSISIEEAMKNVKRATGLSYLKVEIRKIISNVIENIQKSRENQNIGPVEQAKQWILSHLDEDVTVKKIADQVYMNPTYFCKYFKIQTGETILDFVTRTRIERAKRLFHENPNIKLQDVCDKIGYQDTKYFSRLFKQWVGQTPSQYREFN